MKLTMNERGGVIKGFSQQYRRAGKKRKGRILDQVVEATGYNRKAIVERASAEIKQHMGFRRWSDAGLRKVNAQWHFKCLAYSLRRLYPLWQEAQ